MKNILVVGLALGALAAGAAEKTFTGAVDQYWSKPGNWQGGEVPVNGDSVILVSATQTRINNDMPGLTLSGFTFSGYGANESKELGAGSTAYNAYLDGNGFTLAAGGSLTLSSKVRLNQCVNIAFAEGTHELSVAAGARWDLAGSGTFSGAGSLTLKTGLYIPYNNTTFAGDFTAKSGSEVYAFANKPFGEGNVLFENNARLTMFKTGIVIPNDIEF